jgi:small subunit ribosomal protein S17e
MGRIKTSFVKAIAKDLFEKYADKFTTDFEKNKEVIKELIDIKSKRLRNVIAGYITSLKNKKIKQ